MGPIEALIVLSLAVIVVAAVSRGSSKPTAKMDDELEKAEQLFRNALARHSGAWTYVYVSPWTLEGIALDTEQSRLATIQGRGGRPRIEFFQSRQILGSEIRFDGVPTEATRPETKTVPLSRIDRVGDITLAIMVDDLDQPERHVTFFSARSGALTMRKAMAAIEGLGSPIEWHQRLTVLVERGRRGSSTSHP